MITETSLTLPNIINFMPNPIYWCDLEGRMKGCNDAQAKLLGVQGNKSLIGKVIFDLPSKLMQKTQLRDAHKRVITADCVLSIEEKYLNAKQTPLVFLSKISPIYSEKNKIIGVLSISVDITHEQAEHQNQIWILENIIGKVPGHIWWKDKDCRFLGCNDAQASMAGLELRSEIKGKTSYDAIVKNQPEKERRRQAKLIDDVDKKIIATGKHVVIEEPLVLPTGEKAVYLSRKEPLLDSNGKIIGIVGVSFDITPQKEAEKLKIDNEKHQTKAESDKKYRDKIDQAMHDLGSPLSSLKNAVQFTTSMSEQERKVVVAVINKINDIGYGLLSDYSSDIPDNQKPQDMLVSEVLLQELSSKRNEHKYSGVELIDNINLNANFSFIRIEPIDFTRMMSNLINNAVEALEGRDNKKIEIELSQNTINVILTIHDNGKGMPQELIDSIKNKTHKSYDKKNGHGLGWQQIRDTIERNMGKFSISSSEGEWTNINVFFPLVRTPSWVASNVKIIKGDMVVVVDDEPSVHIAWDTKLAPFVAKMPNLEIKHFTFGSDALKFLNKLTDKEKQKVCLLTDYELLNQKINGLDIIEQTGIKRATLVTSHYADFKIRERAKKSRIKILPKDLTFAVSITLDKKIRAGSKKVDLVWIDDNLPWMEGLIEDHYSNLKVDKYEEPISFLEDVAQYPLSTKVVLDMFYTNAGVWQLDGFDVAKKLHEMGYSNLYMAAGETIKKRIPDYLKVIYKDDVHGLSRLDKL